MWAGTAILDTSQVVAAGSAFSDAARDVATVVKLVRNTLMAPAHPGDRRGRTRGRRRSAMLRSSCPSGKIVPWFVVGFVGHDAWSGPSATRSASLPMDVTDPGNLIAAASCPEGAWTRWRSSLS